MKPPNAPPDARQKIQDVLNVLSSSEVFLSPNTRFTNDEMIEWCENWIRIYDKLPQNISTQPL
jgi:hypothetical protein